MGVPVHQPKPTRVIGTECSAAVAKDDANGKTAPSKSGGSAGKGNARNGEAPNRQGKGKKLPLHRFVSYMLAVLTVEAKSGRPPD